ncbi:ABC transporter permease, partial [Streptomyces sp. YIM 98790]|uniref:ABC transporter permease n=1 Tax=Streptomyces sp. YIM 98790 TaxID=2689077 RepID=UPI001A9E692A
MPTSPSAAAEPPARSGPPPARALAAVLVLVPVLVATALWAFAWPTARTAPNDLPIGLAGPEQATAPLAERLGEHDGAFDIEFYESREQAAAALEDREIYAALVPGPQPELLTASAGGPAVAQMLQESLAAQLPEGTEPAVTDVVPAPAADPRGGAFSASVLPIAIAGIATGAMVTALGLRGGRAAAALFGATALAGMAGAAMLHSWLGVLDGNWWAAAGVLMLGALAVAATVSGLAALLGPPGIGVAALVVVFLGNPFSGAAAAPEMLPDPVGLLGRLLPPGATAASLRSVAFFDGSAAGFPLTVLACWAAAGLALLLLGGRHGRGARG